MKTGNAQHLTILHTSDIHAQLEIHDEFFYEQGRPAFKRRGGFATLRTMIDALRRQNPQHTLRGGRRRLLPGQCRRGPVEGSGHRPSYQPDRYDLVLPGNWEVVYGKEMLIKDMNMYTAAKVCANMFHADAADARSDLPAVPDLRPSAVREVGFRRLQRSAHADPAVSGLLARHHVHAPRGGSRQVRERRCARRRAATLVFVLVHMGLAQQLNLANQPCAQGVDYILGADTHERIREPLQGKFCKVTEPGAFASFVGKLDLVVENGTIKEETYALLDVDPERYPEDEEMKTLVAAAREPYRQEISKVIGKTRTPLLRYYVIETPMDNLITDALDVEVQHRLRGLQRISLLSAARAARRRRSGDHERVSVEHAAGRIGDQDRRRVRAADPRLAGKRIGERVREGRDQALRRMVRPLQGAVREVHDRQPAGRARAGGDSPRPAARRQQEYTVLGCEREGDPDNTVCRIVGVADPRRHDITVHQVVTEYLAQHSPVAPADRRPRRRHRCACGPALPGGGNELQVQVSGKNLHRC